MKEERLKEIISTKCPDIGSSFVFNSLFLHKKIGEIQYRLETIFPSGVLGGMTESKAEVFAKIVKDTFTKAEREKEILPSIC